MQPTLQLRGSNITTDTLLIRNKTQLGIHSFGGNTQCPVRNKNPHDTSTYLSVNYKLLQSPQRSKGLLTATQSSLCPPHALQVSREALVQRFWYAQTLCVPATLNVKRIFPAVDTCALGQYLQAKRLQCRSISTHAVQGLAMGKPE